MTVGIGVPHISYFTSPGPELVNAAVERPAPTGYSTINHADDLTEVDAIRRTYADLYNPVSQGVYLYGFFDDYYNRIHIYPNPIDFGYIASPVTEEFQVWNAYLTPQTLDSVVPNNTAGLQITGGPLTTHTYLGLEAQNYSVWADTNGPGVVDGTYSFSFQNMSERKMAVSGVRVIIFPFQPNWVTPVTERLEWFTDVQEMRNGTEQRNRMRQNPRQTLEYEFLVHHDDSYLLDSLLFGWQGRAWGTPLWQQGQRIQTPVQVGDFTVACDTKGYGYVVGGQIIFYATPEIYEVMTIKTITDNSIEFETSSLHFWIASTFIFPVRITYLMGSPAVRKITGEIASGIVQFMSQQDNEAVSNWANSYQGYPVLEIEPNRVSEVTETWDRRITTLDYNVGQMLIFDKDGFSKATRTGQYLSVNREKLAEMRNILNYAQGRWKAFWAPTFDNNLRIVEDVLENSVQIVIKYMQYTRQVEMHNLRRHIRIHLRNGSILYRQIMGADDVNTPNGTETLTLDSSVGPGFTTQDIYMVSYMPLVRLGTDAVEIGWTTMNVANVTLPLRQTFSS